MNFTYLLILVVVLIISPFVLKMASKQNRQAKQNLKVVFIFILLSQILLGFLNWENFTAGRSGFELSLNYPDSFLGLFFIISLLQIILLLLHKSFNILVVVLNFLNSVLIFMGMIRLSSLLGFQAASLPSIGTVFLVMIGNVVGLAFINKDKNLLKKYAGQQKGLSFIPLLVVTGIVVLGGILFFPKISPLVTEQVGQQLEQVASTKISRQLAVENVKKLPEVQEYLKNVPNGKVEVDNELEGEYNVHVYEIKNRHTATFNWYRVSIKSGEVRSEFEVVQNLTGTVTGKLCYPSEVLPEGKIEAKRLSDGEIFVQDYKGSLAREPEPYAFELKEGDYYLRYYVAKNLIGYSTTVCSTGMEESCGDKNPRILRKAQVKKDQVISGYDLCDYYYSDSNAPKF